MRRLLAEYFAPAVGIAAFALALWWFAARDIRPAACAVDCICGHCAGTRDVCGCTGPDSCPR